MAIQFISEDPVGIGYDREFARLERKRKRDEEVGVDTALRTGIAGMSDEDLTGGPTTQLPGFAPAGSVQGLPSNVTTFDQTDRGGPSPAYAQRVRVGESGGDVNAVPRLPNGAPASSARGPDQFIDDTWVSQIRKNRPDLAQGKTDQEILAMRQDPKLAHVSGEMTDAYARENAPILRANGIPVNDDTLRVAHLGPGNAIPLLKADPRTPVSQVLSPKVLAANPSWANMSVGQLVGSLTGRGGGAAAAQPAQQVAGGQPSGAYRSLIRGLAGVPGGGRAALPLIRQDVNEGIADRRMANSMAIAQGRQGTQLQIAGQRQEGQDARQAISAQNRLTDAGFRALIKGDVETANLIFQRAGRPPVPEAVANNIQARQRFAVGGVLANKYYSGDPDAASRFLEAFTTSGDFRQAYEAAGMPRDNQRPSIQWIEQDGHMLMVQVKNGVATPVTVGPAAGGAPGAPPTTGGNGSVSGDLSSLGGGTGMDIAGAPPRQEAPPANAGTLATKPIPTGRGGAGSSGAVTLQYRLEMAEKLGATKEELRQLVLGTTLAPQREQAIRQRIIAMVARDFNIAPKDRQAEVNRIYNEVFGARGSVRIGAPATPIAGAPATAAPAAAPAATPAARPVPNAAQIARLKANPGMAAAFDKKFGPGTSRQYLPGGP